MEYCLLNFDLEKYMKAHEDSCGVDIDKDIYDGNALLAREIIMKLHKELNI